MKKINTYYIAFTALITILCLPQYLQGQNRVSKSWLVYQKELRATEEQIDLSGLAKGIYLLKVYNSNFSKAEKLIIK